jgi:cytochrome P450
MDSALSLPDHVPAHLVRRPDYLRANDLEDPFALSADVFDELPPVFYDPTPAPGLHDGVWVVTRYADVREVYQNSDLYATEGVLRFPELVGETFRLIPQAVDPPEHGKYRVMLNPWFSPKKVAELEPAMRGIITDLIDGFADRGACDAAYDFGRIFPVKVFLDLMGFPQAKLDAFLEWEYALLHNRGDVEKMQWGIRNALAYLRAFIAETKAAPRNDLTSHIVTADLEGRPISDEEIIGTVFFLWIGGLDTVAATWSLMLRRLALNADLQQALRDNPELIPDAIEEFMRVQPLVNSVRRAKADHEIHGVSIRKGDHVMTYNNAGNFDPLEFEAPREVRFDRPQNRHFTLAGGPHRCLGSHLSRRELRIALAEFLRAIPTFRLKPGADRTAYPGLIAAPHVPIVWDLPGRG